MTNRSIRSIRRSLLSVLPAVALVGCGIAKPGTDRAQQNESICTDVAKNYDTKSLQDYETAAVGTNAGWWSWADPAAGSTPASVTVEAIDGGNCGHKNALVFDSGRGHNDYGSGFGPGPAGDMCGAVDGGSDCTWQGLGFWVRVPPGSDPTIQMALNDDQTSGSPVGSATRQCCGGQTGAGGAGGASGAGDCVTMKVPLSSCYNAIVDPTNQQFSASWMNACQGFQAPAGSQCSDWTITLTATSEQKAAGWDKKCTADSDCPAPTTCTPLGAGTTTKQCKAPTVPAADCGTSREPAFAKAQCDTWAFYLKPLACDIQTPDPSLLCASWMFLVSADTFWTFVTVPFDLMSQQPTAIVTSSALNDSRNTYGRAFPSIDQRHIVGLTPRVPNSEANMQFWVDEIDLYRAK